jgi:hypothetical protein
VGPVNLAHATGADWGDDFVRTEAGTRSEGQTCGLYGRGGARTGLVLNDAVVSPDKVFALRASVNLTELSKLFVKTKRHRIQSTGMRETTHRDLAKGCDSGTYGTVLMASTSRIRRLACH